MGKEMGTISDPFRVKDVTVEPLRNRLCSAGRCVLVEPKVMDLLVEFAREASVVHERSDLLDRIWGIGTGSDESLTRAISSLRRAFAEIAPGEEFIETVPKRGYRLIPPVTPLAAQPNPDSQIQQETGRKWPMVTLAAGMAIILLLVTGPAFYRLWKPAAAPSTSAPIIALVQADDGSSASKADAQILLALRTSLRRELNLGGVKVVPASRSSAAHLQLDTSVLNANARDTVLVALRDRAGGATLWSHEFSLDHDADRLVRHYIAWYVGSAVSCALLGNDDPAPFRNPDLLRYFLQGCNGFRRRGDFTTLLHYTHQAVIAAPDSTIARLRYANAAAWVALNGPGLADRQKLLERSHDIAVAEITRHPRLGLGYYTLGLADWAALDWQGAEQNLRKALTLAPSYPYTYNALANVVLELGRNEDALDLRRRAVVADHFSLIQPRALALQIADMGNLEQAHEIIAGKLEPIDPRSACLARFEVDHWWGDARKALDSLNFGCFRGTVTAQQATCARAFLKFRLGEGRSRKALALCLRHPIYDPIRYAGFLGSVDETVKIARSRPVPSIEPADLFMAGMARVRRSPRFMEIASRLGLTRAWIDTDSWPDFCADPSLPYSCREAAEGAERTRAARRIATPVEKAA